MILRGYRQILDFIKYFLKNDYFAKKNLKEIIPSSKLHFDTIEKLLYLRKDCK